MKPTIEKVLLLFSLITIGGLDAQLTSINENFDGFTSQAAANQNGWSMNVPTGLESLMMNINEDGTNKFVQSYAFTQLNVPHYLITPQIVAPDGTTSLTFEASKFTQSGFMGSIEVGLVSSPTDMASFQSLGAAVTLQTTVPVTLSYNVPTSSMQYIAFKFIGFNSHASTRLDNVSYGTSSLSTSEISTKNQLEIVIKNDNLYFIGETDVKNIIIFDASGRRVCNGKVNRNRYDISNLKNGIYYVEVKNSDQTGFKSKFLKR